MRVVVMTTVAAVLASACASGPRGARAPTPLTSVDTVYYEVAGSTPAQWRRELPLPSQKSGRTNTPH